MRKEDLIFTLKVTALGIVALVIYIGVALLQDGGAGDVARFVQLIRDLH